MKIIDINVMLGHADMKNRYSTVNGLLGYIDDYRISSAVVFHSASPMVPWVYNAEITRIANNSDGRIYACHMLDPMLAEKSEPGEGTLIERLRKNRPAAVRMFPASQNYPLNAFFCDHILEALNELRLPLLLDAEEIRDYRDIPCIARDFPDMPIVILRNSFLFSRTITPLLTKLKNVYFDISIMIDTGYIDELVNDCDAGRKLLFGSGLPLHVPAGSLSMILYSEMDDLHKENLLYKNWERISGGIRYDN